MSSLESQTTRYSELEIAKRNKQPCEIVGPAFLHTGVNVSTIVVLCSLNQLLKLSINAILDHFKVTFGYSDKDSLRMV